MSAFLGLDVGTSGVKAVVIDGVDRVLAEASAPLAVSRPRPLWSEQWPDAWWEATASALDQLVAARPVGLSDIAAVGLSGQMLGVALLDEADRALRPALLWSDGRARAECAEIEAKVPGFAERVGCRAMPGFPAPKLRWLARHEPETLERARRILLPKDHVRLRLTGEAASDRADSSATLLMDTAAGAWDPALVAVAGIRPELLPRLVEPDEVCGEVRPEWAARWGLPLRTPVVGGAGDNLCGALGAGVRATGDGCLGIGTSGVYGLANDRFLPALGGGMHTHRHAVRGLFAQHGCVLSAGAALAWIAGVVGAADIGALLAEVEVADIPVAATPVFTPYLAGERTPHDDPTLAAAFSGLTLATTRLHLVQAVLEGVALAFGDCHRALAATGASVARLSLVGGGARSRLWARLIASAIDLPLRRPESGAVGPALGAARLARAGIGGPLVASDGAGDEVEPSAAVADALAAKRAAYGAQAVLPHPGAGRSARYT